MKIKAYTVTINKMCCASFNKIYPSITDLCIITAL